MKVIFFTKYGEQAASTRYRFTQFSPFLRAAGIHYEIQPLLDNDYLAPRLSSGKIHWWALLRGYCKRLVYLTKISQYDVVVIHCELFPYVPGIFEALIAWRGIPIIYDFDDAIFHQYDTHPRWLVRFFFKKKIARLIKRAKYVWAANSYLADYAKRVRDNVNIFPTVIDTQRYQAKSWAEKEYSQKNPFVIGWIGSPSTAACLEEVLPALDLFAKECPLHLKIMGAGEWKAPQIFSIELLEWSEEKEISFLQSLDLGIMPLRLHSAWDRGKSAFKMIQYMGCALPVIATALGANIEVLGCDESCGILVKSQEEWVEALRKMRSQRKVGAAMGKAGRARVEANYSLQAIADEWIATLRKANEHRSR